MNSSFRLKLFFIMIIFALVLLFSVAYTDYIRLKDETIKNHHLQLTQTEEEVKYVLQTIDKAFYLFDQETVKLLEEQTHELMAKYEQEPQFDQWDFSGLSEDYGVDIYIINKHNVVTHSNKADEVGLDFSKCCKTLDAILTERRETGGFFVDAMDVEQSSGEIRRYSYMATKDKEHIIELGYSLEDGAVFEQFNFLKAIDELIDRTEMIESINVLNIGGLSLGSVDEHLPEERRLAFRETRKTKQTTEVTAEDSTITYRYVHYETPFEQGIAQSKVLEIAYDESEFQNLLNTHKTTFLAQFIIVFIVTIIISSLIARWMSRPIHLAFHDSMTGLKNRAAFDEKLKEVCKDHTVTSALLIIDLDKFKRINDQLGHDQGDRFLRKTAYVLQDIFKHKAKVYRIGGDEFAVIFHNTKKDYVVSLANRAKDKILEMIEKDKKLRPLGVGVSIGISLTTGEVINMEVIYKAADLALYRAKKSQQEKVNVYHGSVG